MPEWLTDLRETPAFTFVEATVKATDEEMCGERPGSARASVPVEVRVSLSWCGCAHPPGRSPNLVLLGFRGGFLVSARAVTIGGGSGGRWELQASHHGSVFLVTGPHRGAIQEPTQSRLVRTQDAPGALTT